MSMRKSNKKKNFTEKKKKGRFKKAWLPWQNYLLLASILAYYSYVGVRQYSTSVVSTNFTFSTFGSSVLRGSGFGWLGLVGYHSRLGFSLGDMEKFLLPP
jgi:hypothetical protein